MIRLSDDQVGDLLRQADGALAPLVLPSGLAARVRRRQAQRQRQRRAAALGGAALTVTVGLTLVLVAALSPNHPPPPDGPAGSAAIAQVRQEQSRERIEHAQRQGQLAQSVVDALIDHERRQARQAATAPGAWGDAQEQLQEHEDRAALAIVYGADQTWRQFGRAAAAAAAYRDAIRLFPQSPWAQVARQRLLEMPKS